jgi:thiamine pyrophosphate-dependent acetolactate synthase large subunit-like protein
MDRRKFVARLLADRGGTMVITGIGSATYDVAACGDHSLNFYLWSAMGSTAMVGLGLALARPDRRVAVITGDGDMLMGLGSLATIGVKQPKNLTVIVLDNGHYSASGMQLSHTSSGIDLAGAAKACKLRVEAVSTMDRVDELRALLHPARCSFTRASMPTTRNASSRAATAAASSSGSCRRRGSRLRM